MGALVALITRNPAALGWLALACVAAGAVSGAGGAWYIQGQRLGALQARFDGFVAVTKEKGKAAEKEANAKAAADKKRKEETDAAHKIELDRLAADNKRLRNARAGSGYVPAGPGTAGRSDLACFNRADLERALRRLDDGVSELLDEGDAGTLALTAARRWASGNASGKSPGNPATLAP